MSLPPSMLRWIVLTWAAQTVRTLCFLFYPPKKRNTHGCSLCKWRGHISLLHRQRNVVGSCDVHFTQKGHRPCMCVICHLLLFKTRVGLHTYLAEARIPAGAADTKASGSWHKPPTSSNTFTKALSARCSCQTLGFRWRCHKLSSATSVLSKYSMVSSDDSLHLCHIFGSKVLQ